MKKTISVNIHGRNFLIEEEAHERLSNYLQDIKNHFGSGANVEEVVADIEASIAEKLQSTITEYKNVVTIEDVDALIDVMGTAKDFDDAVGEASKAQQETKTNVEPETRVKRKLYRDMDNAVIAGVASGIATYFDVDPVLIRVLFIAFTFTGGFAFVLYIILWIAMPRAETPNQKLEMRGQAPTLSALERMTQHKGVQKAQSTFQKILEIPFQLLRAFFGAIQKIWRWMLPALRILFGSLLIIGSMIAVAGLGIAALYAMLNINAPYQIAHIPIRELTQSIPFMWIAVTGFLSLALPALFFLLGGIALIRRKPVMTFAIGSILVGTWMLSGITSCALGLRYVPELRATYLAHPSLQIEQRAIPISDITTLSVSGSDMRVILRAGTSTQATVKGRRVDLEGMDIKTENHTLTIRPKETQEDDGRCLGCDMDPVTITVDADTLQAIEATKNARISIKGNLRNNPKIHAENGAEIDWRDLQGQVVTASLFDDASMTLSGKATAISITLDRASLHAQTLTTGSAALEMQNRSTGILGDTTKLILTSSDDSTTLYSGKPTITGEHPYAHVIAYHPTTEAEYERFQEQEGLRDEETPATSTVVSYGDAFFLVETGDISERTFRVFNGRIRY